MIIICPFFLPFFRCVWHLFFPLPCRCPSMLESRPHCAAHVALRGAYNWVSSGRQSRRCLLLLGVQLDQPIVTWSSGRRLQWSGHGSKQRWPGPVLANSSTIADYKQTVDIHHTASQVDKCSQVYTPIDARLRHCGLLRPESCWPASSAVHLSYCQIR